MAVGVVGHKAVNSEIDKRQDLGGIGTIGVGGDRGWLSRGMWFQLSLMFRDRCVRLLWMGLFGKPFLALLQIFIEQHGQIPDHERQHDPREELGCVSKFRFQRRSQFWRESGIGRSDRHRRYRLRVFIQQLCLHEQFREHLNVDSRGVQTRQPLVTVSNAPQRNE
jgi:hypothetical protein